MRNHVFVVNAYGYELVSLLVCHESRRRVERYPCRVDADRGQKPSRPA